MTIDRRAFLSGLTGSLFGAAERGRRRSPDPAALAGVCWLDVAAPFVVVDPAQQLSTEMLLTATCFPGIDGYRDSHNATEYQILLYDAAGKEIQLDNAGKLEIPALRPTLVSMKEWPGAMPFSAAPRCGWRLRRTRCRARAICSAPGSCAGTCRTISTTCTRIRRRRSRSSATSTTPCRFPPLREYHCAWRCSIPTKRNPRRRPRGGPDGHDRRAAQITNCGRTRARCTRLADLKPAAKPPGEALAIAPLNRAETEDGGVVVVRNESETRPSRTRS